MHSPKHVNTKTVFRVLNAFCVLGPPTGMPMTPIPPSDGRNRAPFTNGRIMSRTIGVGGEGVLASSLSSACLPCKARRERLRPKASFVRYSFCWTLSGMVKNVSTYSHLTSGGGAFDAGCMQCARGACAMHLWVRTILVRPHQQMPRFLLAAV